MFLTLLLLSTLSVQQPTQQPAAAPAKTTHAAQPADTSKTKHKGRRSRKAKPAATAPAQRDTTKKP
jgi:hypothetical protein